MPCPTSRSVVRMVVIAASKGNQPDRDQSCT